MFSKFIFSFALLVLSGCYNSKISHPTNAPAVQTKTAQDKTNPNPDTSVATSANQSAAQLADYVLNAEHSGSPKFYAHNDYAAKLAELNRQLLAGHDQDLLARYEAALLQPCGAGLQCSGLTAFRQDTKSSLVALKIAQQKSNTSDFIKLWMISYDLGGGITQEQIVTAALDRLTELLAHFSEIPNDKRALVLAKIEQSIHQEVARLKLDPKATAAPWIKNLAFQDRKELSSQLQLDLLFLTIRFQLYDQGKLTSTFQTYLSQNKASPNHFFQKQTHLQATKPALGQALKLSTLPFDNEYIWLIDQVFSGSMAPIAAKEAWSTMAQDPSRLFREFKSYLQWQFLITTQESNDKFYSFFHNSTETSESLIQSILTKSVEVNALWDQFLSRSKQLQSLIDDTLTGEEKKSAQGIFAALPSNIKRLVVYPHMFIMAFQMTKMKFSVSLNTMFGSFEVDTIKIMDLILNGADKAWFSYGAGPEPLSREAMLESFDFATRSSLFEQFGFTPANFIQAVMDQYVLPAIEGDTNKNGTSSSSRYIGPSVLTASKALDLRFKDPSFQKLTNLCQAFQANGRNTIQNMPIVDLSHSPLLGTLNEILTERSSADITTSIGDASQTRTNLSFFAVTNSQVMALENIRSISMPNLKYIEKMLALVKAQNASARGIKELETRLAGIRQMMSQFVIDSEMRLRQYLNCFFTLMPKDREITSALLSQEEKFLRTLYRNIQAQRAKDPNDNSSHFITEYRLDKNLAPRSFWNSQGFKFSKVDALMRMGYWLNQGAVASIAPNVKYDVYVPGNIKETDDYKEPDIFISYQSTEDQFVAQGLAPYVRSTKFVFWHSVLNYALGQIDDIANELVTLYKIDSEYDLVPAKDRITSDYVQKVMMSYNSFIQNRSDEISLLKLVQKENRFTITPDTNGTYFLDVITGGPGATFDLFFHYLMQQPAARWTTYPLSIYDAGVVQAPPIPEKMRLPLDGYLEFQARVLTLEPNLFGMTTFQDLHLRNEYKGRALTFLQQIKGFIDDLETKQGKGAKALFPLRYEQTAEIPLYSPNIRQKYEGIRIDFEKKSSGF